MTREEAIKILTQYIDYDAETPDYYEMEKACKMAIEALEQQPCEDCISREPFTDSTICEGISCNECSFNRKDKGGCILEERVMKLPSIQPKPKTDVLDKIRAEMHATAEMHEDGDYYLRDEWIDEIIDDYKAESEDKE